MGLVKVIKGIVNLSKYLSRMCIMYEEKYSIEPCYQMEKKDNKEDWEHALSPNLAQCEALGSPVVTIPV